MLSSKFPEVLPVEPSRICILTFYSAQEKLLREAMTRLHEQHPTLGVNRVKITTVDRFQGHESDIVVLDMVVVENSEFLQERGRLNCALTRAKHGLYVVTSFDAVFDPLYKQRHDKILQRRDLFEVMQNWKSRGLVCSSMII